MSNGQNHNGEPNDNVPRPTTPPPPPEHLDIRDIVNKEVEDRTKAFKDIPTPVAFATLENEVKHLWGYLKVFGTVGLFFLGGVWTVYSSIDTKLSDMSKKIDGATQEAEVNYRRLEGRILGEIKGVNHRVDEMIISNGTSKRTKHTNDVNKDTSS